MFEKFKKKTVQDVVQTAKEEVNKCIDDYTPILFSVVGVLFFIACVGKTRNPIIPSITVNNFYF